MTGRGLVLFLTYAGSLQAWIEAGLFERELEPYRRLLPRVGPIAVVSYGGPTEAALTDRLGGLRVLPDRWGLGAAWMAILVPWLYRRELRAAAVLKTNQAKGAWPAAVWAKRLHGKPLIVRCGYVWSVNQRREVGVSWRNRLAFLLERLALRAADRIMVTTEPARRYLAGAHGIREDRFAVVPNAIDTGLFAPDPAVPKERGLVSVVARLRREKNLAALIEALRGLSHLRLQVIGDGPEGPALRRRAEAAGIRAEFCGTIPNHRLPEQLRRAEVFVLPSLYEWSPKSLLEAMACGLPVIGTDVDGTRDVIRHRETGYLCGIDAEHLRAALVDVTGDRGLREAMGPAARAYVVRHHSIDSVVAAEAALIESVVAGR